MTGSESIQFRDLRASAHHRRYKYRLEQDSSFETGIETERDVSIPGDYVALTRSGRLSIKARYAWDGPSGPTLDTPSFMRGSLVHDALYQLMREGLLDRKKFRDPADRLLRTMCREDGMFVVRAQWVYWGLVLFGAKHTYPRQDPPLRQAP